MSACEQCWAQAFDIAVRTGRHQVDVYREIVRQPRSHPHGSGGIDANNQQETRHG